ncbi:MAG TPA: peptide chain release factor-like protein, partial [Bacteroidia bacterium]|nr:peptide chain release factor-like protein [Bacteroidia bacterium]
MKNTEFRRISYFTSILDIHYSIFNFSKGVLTDLPLHYLYKMLLSGLNLVKECFIKATRSGGAGGQHVNKVSSKIEIMFDIPNSKLLSDEQKNILLVKLDSRLTTDGVLRITEDSDRSQHENKEKAIRKFYTILENALKPVKKRKKTKI